MGTEGTIHITVGEDINHAIAWWYREPPKETKVEADKKKDIAAIAGATMVSGGASRPIPLLFDDLNITGKESFIEKELKFARRWLYAKGVLTQVEDTNPVDVELESFFRNCRDGQRPKADLEVGLADSVAVIASNLAMDENRRVPFYEIDPAHGHAPAAPAPKAGAAKRVS
jgi:hypothetical protein